MCVCVWSLSRGAINYDLAVNLHSHSHLTAFVLAAAVAATEVLMISAKREKKHTDMKRYVIS